jgi:tetratricopeptide (TPR) repeat protein
MKTLLPRAFLCAFGLILFAVAFVLTPGASAAEPASVSITVIEGTVEIAPAGTDAWAPATLNQALRPGDRLRTGKLSRAVLRSSNGDMPVRESSLLTINPPREGSDRPVFELVRGFFYFFTRGQPTDIDFRNRLASAAARGTEFIVAIDDNDRIEITVFDGIVELANPQGSVTLADNEQGVAVPGQAPAKAPALNAIKLIQWVLYYPAVLDVDEMPWNDAARNDLAASLAAYRLGDLNAALNAYPAARQPASDEEKVYRAALMLVAGEVEQARTMLGTVAQVSDFSAALERLIAAVTNVELPEAAPRSSTAWMAESYYRQSRLDLGGALGAARNATQAAPGFGFAWGRVAELEFSFGRIDAALEALEKALQLSPRHAAARSLKGFLLAAQNRIPAAIEEFNAAIVLDGALSQAWLGRGLSRIRGGNITEGRVDLRTAAALEPGRAVLRSYLAKAYSDARDSRLADHEFDLARQMDPNDPTVWLYRALHHQQQNRINEGVRDLERSQDLNTNRAVYRSQFLLDQDRAVRSANLAGLYNDAGMTEVSVREAGRAVSGDYANYSAHLFLANSYERLRDPRQINLRYETPAFAEYLVANLLAPVGAGTLSPAISQQEYSKLFERDRLGVSSITEYQSSGSWYQNGAHYGTFGNSTYAIEGLYRSDHGQRPNNDVEQRQLSAHFKQQLSAHDTIYVHASDYRATGGDVGQYYDQRSANPRVRTLETQEPIALIGYHREWSPGHHTLLLGSRLNDEFTVHNPLQPILVAVRDSGRIAGVAPASLHQDYNSTLTIYSGELQQIAQRPGHTTVVGGRFQAGDIETDVTQFRFRNPLFTVPLTYGSRQDLSSDFQRGSVYAYHTWEVVPSLQLVGGLAYDHLTFPENFRFGPIIDREEETSRLSPKGGIVWTPGRNSALRAGYAQGIGGASIDQSYQIEPSQVAGFNQSFRSIIPESIAGANAGARFESAGVSFEHRFPTETYVTLAGEWLRSDVHRSLGVVDFDTTSALPIGTPGTVREHLDFDERSLALTVNQLVGAEWAFGARYRISEAELDDTYPAIAPGVPVNGTTFNPRSSQEALLHQGTLYAIYNHHSGLFAQGQALWTKQTNEGYAPAEPGDDFWQLNAFAGYRLWQRRAEITVGVLNLTNEDYRLNPLTLYHELPRERTFVARLSFKF